MPHSRPRYAAPILKQLLEHSPIVGVLGQRQTGKTTLSEAIAAEYETLDLQTTLEKSKSSPEAFLENRSHPFTIDECQLAPYLFPALKERVRKHPKKGQFILTGSVRFTSRKVIRESLTGRIVNLELLPFSLAESHSEPLPGLLIQWLRAETFPDVRLPSQSWRDKVENRFLTYLKTGGLPGICYFRDPHVRAPRFETHLETLLERDIRLLVNTTLGFRQLRVLCSFLANQQGEPLNYSDLSRRIGISAPSARRLISALESMFLIRTVSTENLSSPVFFFEDQGLASHLISASTDRPNDMLRGLFTCVLPQFVYRPELTAVFSQYRTRGGAKVDVVVRTSEGTIGIIPLTEAQPSASSLSSARSFLASNPGAKIVIAHRGAESKRITPTILSIPYQLLVSDPK